MDRGGPNLVIVTPVFEDADAAARLFRDIAACTGKAAFVVAVDDGSVRQPVRATSIAAAGLDGVVLRLRRNVGHQRAIAVGLSYVAEHHPRAGEVVVMDSDGEDAPASLPQLLEDLRAPDVDVVVARRRQRREAFGFRVFYVIYKWVFRVLTGRAIDFGNFMALKDGSVRRLAAMQELWLHVAACVLTSKLRVHPHPLDRASRYAGESKMNFVSLALHGFKALMVFAEDVLVRVGIVCAAIAVAATVGSVAAILLKLGGFATPGWFSVALGILFLVFLQTGALTLMTLMLTGVVRGGSVATVPYTEFILAVERADAAAQA